MPQTSMILNNKNERGKKILKDFSTQSKCTSRLNKIYFVQFRCQNKILCDYFFQKKDEACVKTFVSEKRGKNKPFQKKCKKKTHFLQKNFSRRANLQNI